MRNAMNSSIAAMLLGIVLVGCGAAAKMITVKSQSERTDVFREVADAGAPPRVLRTWL